MVEAGPMSWPWSAQLEEPENSIKSRAGLGRRQESSWGAPTVTERCRKEVADETEERKESQASKHLLLPVDHLLHGVKVMAHVESCQIAQIRNTQVEVEHFPFVTLQLRWHANGSIFSLLHQSQVFQQTSSFLLARAKKNSDPSLDQGREHTIIVLRPLEKACRFSCRVRISVRFYFKKC